ncbi:hypothetical protein D1007_53707 [Hordeum vulgare]|nr:hypothetical protein D1007_53707 [Hordeum vulgare]
MLGHLYKEHGKGIHPPSSLVFKDLKASWNMRAGQGPGGGRGRRGGRHGGWSGQGLDHSSDIEKNGAGEKDSCLADDEDMVETDSNRKRSPAEVLFSRQPMKHAALGGGPRETCAPPIPFVPHSPSSKQEQKRARTGTLQTKGVLVVSRETFHAYGFSS